jgi:hypothetical protein
MSLPKATEEQEPAWTREQYDLMQEHAHELGYHLITPYRKGLKNIRVGVIRAQDSSEAVQSSTESTGFSELGKEKPMSGELTTRDELRIEIEYCFIGHNFPNTEIVDNIQRLIERIGLSLISDDEEYTEQRNLSNETVDNMGISVRNELRAEQRARLSVITGFATYLQT